MEAAVPFLCKEKAPKRNTNGKYGNVNCTPNVRQCDILLTGGVKLYAKRDTKVHRRVQADGRGDHAQGKTELPGN